MPNCRQDKPRTKPVDLNFCWVVAQVGCSRRIFLATSLATPFIQA